ncbi:MAG: hypothetical protein R2848_17230 [Thermomicrobiales bacterium]
MQLLSAVFGMRDRYRGMVGNASWSAGQVGIVLSLVWRRRLVSELHGHGADNCCGSNPPRSVSGAVGALDVLPAELLPCCGTRCGRLQRRRSPRRMRHC